VSAVAVSEGIKLGITLTQLMMDNRGNLKECVHAFKGVAKHVYFAYLLLAISYAIYNQTIFYVMKLVDPGTFSLFKSLGPCVVALLDFIAYRKTLTQAQVFCLMIQIFGIIPVTATPNPETGKVQFVYGVKSVIVMTAIIVFAGFNTVYNAGVVKKESANYPMNVMNSILYSAGCLFNLMLYFANKRPGDESFFYGYDNINVLVLLFLNSTVGITISMVYKYGDAVLKTISQPVVSATLLFLSNILFDTPLDIIKISGAGTVILSTMLYMKLPPPQNNDKAKATASRQEMTPLTKSPRSSTKGNEQNGKKLSLKSKGIAVIGFIALVCYSNLPKATNKNDISSNDALAQSNALAQPSTNSTIDSAVIPPVHEVDASNGTLPNEGLNDTRKR